MSRRVLSLLAPLAVASACVVESSRPPLEAGPGLTIDPATQTLGIDPAAVPVLSDCPVGQVPRRTASGWSCAPHDEAALPPACPDGQVITRNAAGWACVAPIDSARTPAVLACATGQFVQKTSTGWTCAEPLDDFRTPVLDECPPGAFVRRTAAGWDCAAPIDPEQVPLVLGCAAGLFVQRVDGGWTCAQPVNPVLTPVVAGCLAGQFVQKTSSGWACAESVDSTRTPVLGACAPGLFVQRTESGWGCAPPVDEGTTPVVPTCEAGQYVRRTADGWACAAAEVDRTRTPVIETGCATGSTPRRTLNGWDCVPAFDSARSPFVLACNPGQYVRKTSSGWDCANLSGLFVGNVQGDVTGNVTGRLTGNVVGDVTGNVTGNLTGNVVGDVQGDLTGNVTGDVTGNVVGNVVGNVLGDVIGDVQGNVSGTASNVTGTVAIANGGTGATAFAANGLVIANGAASALVSLPPTPGALLVGRGSPTTWQAVDPVGLPLARRTSGPLTLHVRSGGNDACDGTAASTGTGGACATASLQRALDLVPDLVEHPVTIDVGSGTFRVAAANATAVEIAKLVRAGGAIVIRGAGPSTVLSGAAQGAPNTAVGARGFLVRQTSGVTVRDLTISRFVGEGVLASASEVSLDGVSVESVGGSAVVCDRAGQCSLTNVSLTNSANGLVVSTGAYASLRTAFTSNGHSNLGIGVLYGSTLDANGTVTVQSNPSGVLALRGSSAAFTGTLNVTSSGNVGIQASEQSTIAFNDGTVQVGVSNADARAVISRVNSYVGFAVTGASTFSCAPGAANTIGFLSEVQGMFATGGPGAITISGCRIGIHVNVNASFINSGPGTRTITDRTTAVRVTAASLYMRGAFDAPGTNDCPNSTCL